MLSQPYWASCPDSNRLIYLLSVGLLSAAYRAFRRTTLEKLNLDQVDSVGYGFQVDLAWRVAKMGLNIVERPITYVERELGASKMSGFPVEG